MINNYPYRHFRIHCQPWQWWGISPQLTWFK